VESYVGNLGNAQVGTLVSNANDVEVCLFQGEVFKMNGNVRGVQVACQKGRLWITQANDPEDHMLKAGDRFVVTRPGLVLVQGVREGQARIIPPTPSLS